MDCKYPMESEVNQILWDSIFDERIPYGRNGNDYKNDIFEIKSYRWDESQSNDYHFYHKPSGLKIYWYKYPLRSPMSNMEISHKQFLMVLRDCFNSFKFGITYDIDKWWEENKKTYCYTVNTLNEEFKPIQLSGEIIANDEKDAIDKLIKNKIIYPKGYEFLDLRTK